MAGDDLRAELEAAAEGLSDSPTDKEEQETKVTETPEKETEQPDLKAEGDKPTKSGRNAETRIQELVTQRDDWRGQVDDLQTKLTERDQELGKLVDLLESREKDTAVVKRINEIYNEGTPEIKAQIESLDKMIQGIETEVEEGETTPAEANKELKAIQQTKDALEEKIAAVEANNIILNAQVLAEKYFNELSEDYNEEDRDKLNDRLIEVMDWERLEEDPDALPDVLAAGFQKSVDWLGTPKGKLESELSALKNSTEKATETVTEKEVDFDQDWGALKKVKTPTGEVLQPVVSDDDFAAALGARIRSNREQG